MVTTNCSQHSQSTFMTALCDTDATSPRLWENRRMLSKNKCVERALSKTGYVCFLASHLLELGVGNASGHSDLEHLTRLQDAEALKLVHDIPDSTKKNGQHDDATFCHRPHLQLAIGNERSSKYVYFTALLASPVVVDAALHTRVGLDAADEVARGAQQCHVEVLHGRQESLRHGRLHQSLQQGSNVSNRFSGVRGRHCTTRDAHGTSVSHQREPDPIIHKKCW